MSSSEYPLVTSSSLPSLLWWSLFSSCTHSLGGLLISHGSNYLFCDESQMSTFNSDIFPELQIGKYNLLTWYLEKEKATHSSIWPREFHRQQSMEAQRVRHEWVTFTSSDIYAWISNINIYFQVHTSKSELWFVSFLPPPL